MIVSIIQQIMKRPRTENDKVWFNCEKCGHSMIASVDLTIHTSPNLQNLLRSPQSWKCVCASCKHHIVFNLNDIVKMVMANQMTKRNLTTCFEYLGSKRTKKSKAAKTSQSKSSISLLNALPPAVLEQCVLPHLNMKTLSKLDMTNPGFSVVTQQITKQLAMRKRVAMYPTGTQTIALKLQPWEEAWSLRFAMHALGVQKPHTGNSANEVWTCGLNAYGQLGLGDQENRFEPQRVTQGLEGSHIEHVMAGGRHTLLFDSAGNKGKGCMLGFGRNRHQQLGSIVNSLGQSSIDVTRPIKIPLFDGDSQFFMRCALGFDHNIAMSSEGVCVAFGRDENGRLGQGKQMKCTGAAAGLVHSGIIANDGTLTTFGNKRNGRLGRPSEENDDEILIRENVDEHYSPPKTVDTLRGMRIVQVAMGSYHTVVLNSKGEVFTFGYGKCGQLGHGDENDMELPKQVQALKGKWIVQIATGFDHTVALSNKGEVFTFGAGDRGQLGHGYPHNECLPRSVEDLCAGPQRVVQIAAGGHHTVVLFENGVVATFGNNENGQCGHGSVMRENLCFPKRVHSLAHRRAVQVAAGAGHVVVLLAGGGG